MLGLAKGVDRVLGAVVVDEVGEVAVEVGGRKLMSMDPSSEVPFKRPPFPHNYGAPRPQPPIERPLCEAFNLKDQLAHIHLTLRPQFPRQS